MRQGSILGPLLFLIYINDFFDDLSTKAKLFADDNSLFSVVRDIITSATHLNNDLRKMNSWALQWNAMVLILTLVSKLRRSFSCVYYKKNKSSLYLLQHQSNRASLISKTSGNYFKHQFKLKKHIKKIPAKVDKTIGSLRKLQNSFIAKAAKHRLSDLILITGMLYMTTVIIIFFIRKWS